MYTVGCHIPANWFHGPILDKTVNLRLSARNLKTGEQAADETEKTQFNQMQPDFEQRFKIKELQSGPYKVTVYLHIPHFGLSESKTFELAI